MLNCGDVLTLMYHYNFFADFIYPHGWDWDNSFVSREIQYWEQFYLNWIRHGKGMLVLYPDNFASDLIRNTLKKIANFMSFEWNDRRVDCALKRDRERFPQKQGSYEKTKPKRKLKRFIASKMNSCSPNETYKWNIYKRKHFIWINSAIRNVKRELQNRGFDSTFISDYEMKHFMIYVCPET